MTGVNTLQVCCVYDCTHCTCIYAGEVGGSLIVAASRSQQHAVSKRVVRIGTTALVCTELMLDNEHKIHHVAVVFV